MIGREGMHVRTQYTSMTGSGPIHGIVCQNSGQTPRLGARMESAQPQHGQVMCERHNCNCLRTEHMRIVRDLPGPRSHWLLSPNCPSHDPKRNSLATP